MWYFKERRIPHFFRHILALLPLLSTTVYSVYSQLTLISGGRSAIRNLPTRWVAASRCCLPVLDKITAAFDSGDIVLGVFLDFSKAFDTIDYQILLYKMYKYGIRGIALKWMESYLSNRRQFVLFKYVKSEYAYVTRGVPHGSMMSPLLFLLYVN